MVDRILDEKVNMNRRGVGDEKNEEQINIGSTENRVTKCVRAEVASRWEDFPNIYERHANIRRKRLDGDEGWAEREGLGRRRWNIWGKVPRSYWQGKIFYLKTINLPVLLIIIFTLVKWILSYNFLIHRFRLNGSRHRSIWLHRTYSCTPALPGAAMFNSRVEQATWTDIKV